ncbi:MAG: LysR family transcriptional regulator [Lachnospiraceae bacterium]
MTIRHLKIFLTVYESNGMSAAAQKLYVSQPTVSQAVAELEKYYGVRLFERMSQKLYITEAGRKLLPYARHILDSFEKMELEMKDAGEHAILRIGCSVSVGTCMINQILDEAEVRMPELKIYVTVDNSSAIEKKLLSNEVDMGIVEGLIENRDLELTPLWEDELVVVCGRNYHLAGKNKLDFRDLDGENLISRESGSIERNQLELLFEQKDIHFNRCFTCTNTEAIKNAVICGRGIAMLPKRMVQKEYKSGEIVVLPLKETPVKRMIHLVKHKDKFVFEGMRQVMEVCKASSIPI